MWTKSRPLMDANFHRKWTWQFFINWDSSFTTIIKTYKLPNVLGHPPPPFLLKPKQITSLGTQSKAFSRSTNIKNNFSFLAEIFPRSPQNKHSINSSSPWHKSILHFIYIYIYIYIYIPPHTNTHPNPSPTV